MLVPRLLVDALKLSEHTNRFTSVLNITLVYLRARPAFLLELNIFETSDRGAHFSYFIDLAKQLDLCCSQESPQRWFISTKPVATTSSDEAVGRALGFACAGHTNFGDTSQPRIIATIREHKTQSVVYAEVCDLQRAGDVDVVAKADAWTKVLCNANLPYGFSAEISRERVGLQSLQSESNYSNKSMVTEYVSEYADILQNEFYFKCALGSTAPLLENWTLFQFVMQKLTAINAMYNDEKYNFHKNPAGYDFLVVELKNFEDVALKCSDQPDCIPKAWAQLEGVLKISGDSDYSTRDPSPKPQNQSCQIL